VSFIGELKRRNVIRVGVAYLAAAWLLIQILETLFPIFGLEETSIRVVVIVLAIGFLPAVIAAWVFEITPEGLVKDSGTPSQRDVTSHARFDRIIIATLVLAVAVFAVHTFVLDPQRDAAEREAAREAGRTDALVESFGDKSIAVLAFENISSDPEQAYFADGISEELLNLLARVEGLRVTSRTSAFKFKGGDASIPEIAEQLNVAYVLEGSVRSDGEDIRITAQLIDARSDTHVWSETYDRNFEHVFAIQDDVAARVVEELKIEMSVGMPTAPRHNPAAYSLYLQAKQLLNTNSRDFERADNLLTRALQIDPDYADAKIELSFVYGIYGDQAYDAGDLEEAEQYLQRAAALRDEVAAADPDNVALNVASAWVNQANFQVAAGYIERALNKDPMNDRALNISIILLTRLWREDQAIPIAAYLADRDPLYSHVQWNLGRAHLNAGAYEAAEKTFRIMVAIDPGSAYMPGQIGWALLFQGEAEAALEQFQSAGSDETMRLHGSVLALHNMERHEEAAEALNSLIALRGPDEGRGLSFFIATASAWIGNLDVAFDYMEKQRLSDPGWLRVVANSPLYEKFETDPRWLPFLERAGLASEQLGAVEFNPRLPPDLLTHSEKRQ
jgi:TolB-like protein/tetratricopeptide (TPR) repeat protein